MLLKRIKLNNIRSYKDQEIVFPEGSTLLSGDIGSGKTSILLGIEFALFGLQPGQRGSALLREGEETGGVEIDFEVDGKQVSVERTLKRKKTIAQDLCTITIDGEKSELSVTELKNRILEILNYPKEFSRKQNILYKFTVYTPQEEMKQIILQDPEMRINTLRHVFGIDKYKRILENVSIILGKIREERRLKEGISSDIDKDNELLEEKENNLETKRYNLVSVEKELFLKGETRKSLEEDIKGVLEKREEKIRLQQEVEKTKIMIVNKKDSLVNNSKLLEQLKIQIKELEDLKFDESKIVALNQELSQMKNQKDELVEKNIQLITKIQSLVLKNQENDNLKKNLSKMEICPTCLQDVGPVYKSNVFNKIDSDTSESLNQIKNLEIEKKLTESKISAINNELSLVEKQIQELNFLRIKCQGIEEKQERKNSLENSNLALNKDLELLEAHTKSLQNSIRDLSKFDSLFESKQNELNESRKEERMAEIKVAELKKEIDVFSNQIEELRERINKIKEIKKQAEYLAKLENWLSNKFIPVISFIEKNVMVKLKAEFSQLFGDWFNMLVSDSFNVKLDDDFTPIIEQQDYELDYAYLSGGERTAVALAYRLSLNQVINSLLSKIKTRDLVILDEPTDGFSTQQLDRMRDVLEELNVAQLIIVSHEQKMEDYVENVIKFKKENGVSVKDGE